MFRWLFVVFLALMVIDWLLPALRRIGLGRLPGDLRFRLMGREWNVPIATTLLLSVICSFIARYV